MGGLVARAPSAFDTPATTPRNAAPAVKPRSRSLPSVGFPPNGKRPAPPFRGRRPRESVPSEGPAYFFGRYRSFADRSCRCRIRRRPAAARAPARAIAPNTGSAGVGIIGVCFASADSIAQHGRPAPLVVGPDDDPVLRPVIEHLDGVGQRGHPLLPLRSCRSSGSQPANPPGTRTCWRQGPERPRRSRRCRTWIFHVTINSPSPALTLTSCT